MNVSLEKVQREMPGKQACPLFQVYISTEILINILCHESRSFYDVGKECEEKHHKKMVQKFIHNQNIFSIGGRSCF